MAKDRRKQKKHEQNHTRKMLTKRNAEFQY